MQISSSTHSNADMPVRIALLHPVAAPGGVLVRFDRPALTPALNEIRLLFPACCLDPACHRVTPGGPTRLGRLTAVSFTLKGAPPAGATHAGNSDA